MKAFATLIDEIESSLQDSSNTYFSAAELAYLLEDVLKEMSLPCPYIMRETFKMESRTGSATSTTTRALVDSTNVQFLSTDVGKVIHNTTDNTWAVVTAYVSTSQLTLSENIMASGEEYEMYNEECRSNREIYIGDILDYVGKNHGVIDVEFPVGTKRNFEVEGDVLRLLIDFDPDDSADADADVTAYVWFKKRQRVSQLTDLAGEIDYASYAAGTTTIHIDGLQATGTFQEGTLFTIEGLAKIYRATADATIASNECDVVIYPGLEYAIADGADITIIGSTLSEALERVAVELTCAKALLSKSIYFMNRVNDGGGNVWQAMNQTGKEKLQYAYRDLDNLRAASIRATHPRN